MKTAKVIQSKLSRRCHSVNSSSSGMLFKCLIAILILLAFFIVRADNQPVDTESDDALFIDEKGNVGIGTNQPTAKLDVKGTVNASKFTRDGLNPCVPIGAIMAYGGDVTKKEVIDQLGDGGWLVCDGNEVKRDEYPELFNVIGVAFGEPNDSIFNLPDLRGRFVRGVDVEDANNANWRDPEHDTRDASASGGNTGNKVGSVQLDELIRHDHPLNKTIYEHHQSFQGSATPKTRIPLRSGPDGATEWLKETNPYGGKETRPKNIYVNWIIKAR